MARTNFTRRALLRSMGLTAGGLLLPLSGLGREPGFRHGVASGDPLADRVILWTRVTPAEGQTGSIEVRWEMALDGEFRNLVTGGRIETDASRDYTVKVDAAGLEPGSRYHYRFRLGDLQSPVGRTRTLPADGVKALTFAVLSCSNYPQGYFNVYQEVARRDDIDAVLHLGDYIYEYEEGYYANPHAIAFGHHVEPPHEIVSLADYRARHAIYKTEPGLQAVHAAHPMIAVWDDHESANDSWRHGAENHDESQGPWRERKRDSVQAYREWLPIRDVTDADPLAIYRHFDFGGLADLMMLDARLIGRSQPLLYGEDMIYRKGEPDADAFRASLNDPARTILGDDQLQWLTRRLEASRAPWQILGQQVLMGRLRAPDLLDHATFREGAQFTREVAQQITRFAELGLPLNLDAWDGYPASRERVYAATRAHGTNLLALAGDTHNAWAFELKDEQGRGVGAEFATPSVTSPGMEGVVPVPPGIVAERFVDLNPELVYLDAERRGWLEVTVTPEAATGRWHFVTTVLSRRYQALLGPAYRMRSGETSLDLV
ncbi:MAG: alkaline phosphatase D family protein [Gammaproteobacteria bacterium]|nr:alkaline phosphatase D family protein [Gammaproteobacteria bacterium]